MKHPPYTLAEAQKICQEFQHLVGSLFRNKELALIDKVIVAPHGTAEKSRFLMLYLTLGDARMALHADYKGSKYTVLLISGSLEANGLEHEELHRWLIAEKRHAELTACCTKANAHL